MGLPRYSDCNVRGFTLGGKIYFFEWDKVNGGFMFRQVQIDKTCLDCSDGQSFRDYANSDENLEVHNKTYRFTDDAKALAKELPSRKEYENSLK